MIETFNNNFEFTNGRTCHAGGMITAVRLLGTMK